MVQTPEKLTHANKKKKSGRSYVHLETNLCGKEKTMLLLVELFHHCPSKPIKTRTGGNSNFFSYDSGNKRCCTIPAAATI